MNGVSDAARDPGLCASRVVGTLSGRMAVLRSGKHLALIALRLRELEAVMLAASQNSGPVSETGTLSARARLQSLDLTIQELSGLSEILIGTASQLPEVPDQAIDALVDLPRLETLSRALHNLADHPAPPEIVIF